MKAKWDKATSADEVERFALNIGFVHKDWPLIYLGVLLEETNTRFSFGSRSLIVFIIGRPRGRRVTFLLVGD